MGEQHYTIEDYIKNYSQNKKNTIKVLFGFFKGHGLLMAKALFFRIVQESPVWVIPIVTANVINAVTYADQHSASEIYINVGIAFLFVVQNIGSTYLQACNFNKVIREIEVELREALVRKLQQLSIGFHREMQSGRLLSKVMRDVENIQSLITALFNGVVVFVLGLCVSIGVITKNSPVALLFFVLTVPVAVAIVYMFRKPMNVRNQVFRQEMEETQAAVAEMVELIPVTRAHGLEQEEINKMSSHFRSIRSSGYSLDRINALFGASGWVTSYSFQLLCLAFTATLAYRGRITVGEVVLYQTYFSQIVGQVLSLTNLYPMITKGMESVQSIGEILGANNMERNNAIIPIGELQGMVTFQDVCFQYHDGENLVLDNFNIEVKAGESIAFVGSSGAGKSTILNLMIGFDEPTAGRIMIDKINMANLDMKEYRSQIAVVPQNTILFSGTIRDNIAYGKKEVSDEMIWKVLKEVGLYEMISEMPKGLDTRLEEHGANLSGGQRQRLSIARALIRNPKIIIFDEATSALDSESEKQVQEATKHMMQHCTTFLVAHRLSTIRDADRICVIEKGHILEEGSYEELMAKKGYFYQLKKMQE